jgi:hypothetical protein
LMIMMDGCGFSNMIMTRSSSSEVYAHRKAGRGFSGALDSMLWGKRSVELWQRRMIRNFSRS